jgi:hypothetical protein
VQGFGFKSGTIARDQKPVSDLVAEQFDAPERWEFAAELRVFRVRAFRKYKPDAVVLRRPGMVTQHQDDPVPNVDREPREHSAHLGTERLEGIQDKFVWQPFPELCQSEDTCSKMHDSIRRQRRGLPRMLPESISSRRFVAAST